jgi:hypothetical protein
MNAARQFFRTSKGLRPICTPLCALICILAAMSEQATGQDPAKREPNEPLALELQREGWDYFETHIRPVLVEHCYACHSAKASIVQGGLRLDTAAGMKQGGDSGTLLGQKADESLLIAALNWEQNEMPPAGKLPDETIQRFRDWVEMGAPDPRDGSDVESNAITKQAAPETANHWAFTPPIKVETPSVKSPPSGWPIRETDRFILDRLQQQGLQPSPMASRRELLRRLHFVLTGLPPTTEQYAAFENIASEEEAEAAYRQTVDQLLDSPDFGQRWGRHWLDVARYADTKGYVFQEDRNYPQAYRFRDWVIDSFNSDLPYDQFILAQLAADHLGDANLKPAMGFLTLGRRFINNQHDIIDDRIDVMSRGLMGLTVACARCHDHKYDPVSTEEYYSLYGIFASGRERTPAMVGAQAKAKEAAQEAAKENLEAKAKEFVEKKQKPDGLATDDSATEKQATEKLAAETVAAETVAATPAELKPAKNPSGEPLPPPEDLLMLRDAAPYHDPVVFLRGNPDRPGKPVPRQFLQVVSRNPVQSYDQSSGRLEMARAIASADNPLTARVWVNRVWMHLIGSGLVATPSDFGTRGERPTHPELLDWLAIRFVEEGWSTKWLIREIVLSRTFCQTSQVAAEAQEQDPDNRYLWRMHRRRLDWETMRDNLLLTAGELDRTSGGPSVDMTSQPFTRRRTVYGFVERQNLPGMFRTFDFANPDTHTPQRPKTVVPQQALYFMNSPFVLEQALNLAARPALNQAKTDWEKVESLFQLVYGRSASESEREFATRFLREFKPSPTETAPLAWTYGWGNFDAQTGAIEFQPLPFFTGAQWQGGTKLPDDRLGWVMLSADGGHPGLQGWSAIRRWTSPTAGTLKMLGTLAHASDQGDGVRCQVVSDRQGRLQEWTAFSESKSTELVGIAIEAGEAISFVTDCRESLSHDSFDWKLELRLRGSSETNSDTNEKVWRSDTDFRGPMSIPLEALPALAQVLLMTNEFLFVD